MSAPPVRKTASWWGHPCPACGTRQPRLAPCPCTNLPSTRPQTLDFSHIAEDEDPQTIAAQVEDVYRRAGLA